MSWVTNVMISGWLDGEPETLGPIPNDERGQLLTLQTGRTSTWGGNKYPEVDIWAAAFNYLPWDGFAAWVPTLPWRQPERVQVFVKSEADPFFYEYRIEGDRLAPVTEETYLAMEGAIG